MTVPQIDPWPPAPGPSDPGEVFDEKAFDFTAGMEPRRQQMNQVAQFVNDTVTQFAQDVDQAVDDATQTAVSARDTAVASANTATQAASDAESDRTAAQEARDAALAVVGFAGKWADLAGALNTPATVFHQGAYWRLLNDLADVTASEPATDNADWLFVYSNAELRRKLLDEATLYADFVNGDYRLYEGIGAGVVRNKAFGDLFNFTRSSNAAGSGASVVESVSADMARFVYAPETSKRSGLLLEEQRTNLILWSEDFTNSAWTKIAQGQIVNTTVPSPIAGKYWQRLETSTAGVAAAAIRQSVNIADAIALSVLVKPDQQRYLMMRCGATKDVRVVVDPENKSIVASSNFTGEVYFESLDDGAVRVAFCETGFGTGSANVELWAKNEASASVSAEEFGAVGDGLYILAFQLEPGSFPSSYIKTEGTQVTRAADKCSRALGQESGRTEFTLCGEVVVNYQPIAEAGNESEVPKILTVDDGTNSNRVQVFGANSTSQVSRAAATVTVAGVNYFIYGGGLWQPGVPRRMALSLSGSKAILAADGAIVGEVAIPGPPPGLSVARLGARSTGAQSCKQQFQRSANYIPRALSEAELIAVTESEYPQ